MKKEKKKKQLSINKISIQNLDNLLTMDEQKLIKAGSETIPPGTTNHPVYCIP